MVSQCLQKQLQSCSSVRTLLLALQYTHLYSVEFHVALLFLPFLCVVDLAELIKERGASNSFPGRVKSVQKAGLERGVRILSEGGEDYK